MLVLASQRHFANDKLSMPEVADKSSSHQYKSVTGEYINEDSITILVSCQPPHISQMFVNGSNVRRRKMFWTFKVNKNN